MVFFIAVVFIVFFDGRSWMPEGGGVAAAAVCWMIWLKSFIEGPNQRKPLLLQGDADEGTSGGQDDGYRQTTTPTQLYNIKLHTGSRNLGGNVATTRRVFALFSHALGSSLKSNAKPEEQRLMCAKFGCSATTAATDVVASSVVWPWRL